MQVTIEKLLEVNAICNLYSSAKLSKFVYACKRTADKIKPILEKEYFTPLANKRAELAMTGDKGEILMDEKNNFKFTPENFKKLTEFEKELKKKMVEAEGHLASDFSEIKDDIVTLDALNGWVVNVNVEELIQ